MSQGTDDQPLLGAPLAGAEDASIDPAKLRLYALDPDHPVGRHKATVFRRALGIGVDDWEYLRDEILAVLPDHPVTAVREPMTAHEGCTYEVLVPITGLGEKSERTLKRLGDQRRSAGAGDGARRTAKPSTDAAKRVD